MVRPSRRGRLQPLASDYEAGTVVDDEIDWETGGSSGGPVIDELDDIPDVNAPAPADGDVLTWDSTPGEWVASPPAGSSDPNAELNIEGGQSVIQAHGAMGTTETIDPTLGNVHTGTLDANVTYTLSAPVGSGAAEIEFQRTGSGGPWTETWPGSVTWLGGVAPTPPTSGNTGIVILRSLDGGTTWLGIAVGGSGAAAIEILDDGVSLTATPVSIDFVGAGVTATETGDAVTVTIPAGGTSALDAYIWRPLMDGAGNVITDGTGQAVMAYSAA